ncbi:DUF748 domain-containing protein [Cyclobacterium qasimii]|uniref:DUF748 domain-containing protein n=1 Tax=Cyclobacterium qasimii TaxID=1350429 RepID=A0A512CE06_9BACT|nr:DUF748 domain-containing protein [Cyclobacterium qasimii]GEO22445.1 hypothetical protein CQA01_29790 [Cyclobacterium qasimii]
MRKKTSIILGIIIVLLIVFRLFLPDIVLHFVNKQLSEMEEYTGNVEDIDIALIRGAYVIDGIEILKRDTEDRESADSIPFFTSPHVDLSIHWNALFKGKIVGELVVDQPKLNFVNTEKNDPEVKQDTADFRGLIRDLMPLDINRFEINQGEIHYIDNMASPKVDVFIKELDILAENLTNEPINSDSLPSSINASGLAYGGTFNLDVKLNALADQPTFDMNAEIEKVDLVGLNDFLRAYGNFDVKKGEFNVFTEFAAKGGKFKGYVKPLIKELDIVQWNKEEGNVLQILWETIVAGAAELFENQREDQIGSKLLIENTFENPDIHTGQAILLILRNAFVQALRPSIEQSINFSNVEKEESEKGFFKGLFGGDKKD